MRSRAGTVILVVLALICIHEEASASSVGKIYGTWVPVRFTPLQNMSNSIKMCHPKLVFTATAYAVWMKPNVPGTPDRVTYMDKADGKVGIIGTGGYAAYYFLDDKHVVNPSDPFRCVYEKR